MDSALLTRPGTAESAGLFLFVARAPADVTAGCAPDFFASFCAIKTALTDPTSPTRRMTTPAMAHFKLRGERAVTFGGVSRVSSVCQPQCGHGAVMPIPSAGNSIGPPHCAQMHLRYFVSAIAASYAADRPDYSIAGSGKLTQTRNPPSPSLLRA